MKSLLMFLLFAAGVQCFGQGGESNETTLMVFPFDGMDRTSSINNMLLDANGVIWTATDKGVFIVDPGNNKSVSKLDIPEVTDVVSDNSDRMWASAGNILYNINTKEKVILPNDGNIIDLEYYSTRIWMATDKGLFAFSPRTGRIDRYHPNNSDLVTNKITFLHADRHGILWIGTEQGYIRVEDEKWKLEDKGYKMIVTKENNEGQWIISEDDMFLLNKYNRLFPVGIDEALYSGKINAFTFDQDGRIYIASDILVRYDPYNEEIEDFSNAAGLVNGKCLSILMDKNENIWIGTAASGLFLLKFSDIVSNVLSVNCVVYNHPSCNGDNNGSIGVIVNGGISPYTFQWNLPEISGEEISGLPAGKYSVTVTDKQGTTYASSVTLSDPEEIRVSDMYVTQLSGPSKNDATITSTVEGGTGDYTYRWNNGKKSSKISELRGGYYSLTVTDANGCQAMANAEIDKIKLLPELTMDKISVGLTIRLEQLFFDADSTNLREDNYPVLDEIFEFMEENASVMVEIGGHTNTIPSHEYCDKLSTERAQNVAFYLYQKGISQNRLSFRGYGKREPLTEDRSLSGRQRNQRVELKVLSK